MGDSADLTRKALMIAGTVGAGMIARKLTRQPQQSDLRGQVVFITGGSRGLGLLMAREFAREGCRIAICARDVQELEGATRDIEQIVPSVLALPCDVADQSQVSLTLEKIIRHFGQIDVLVNNAGIIAVGPVETMTRQDFEHAMNVMFWGTVFTTLAVLPEMIRRQSGRIVNVTNGRKGQRASIDPVLAARNLQSSPSRRGCGLNWQKTIFRSPRLSGLMRTGSHVNAFFKDSRMPSSRGSA